MRWRFLACLRWWWVCWIGIGQALGAGSVIFIHPDGASLNHWNAARLYWVGPDAELNWDRLPGLALYRSHLEDCLTASSNAGGTVHAYGRKVVYGAFGNNGGQPITALSGKPYSIMREAQRAGMAVGIINSGDLIEPGTATFLASVSSRTAHEEIIAQLLAAQPDILMGGGEQWFLPKGVIGRHGPGQRSDGRNLIAEAQAAGYTIVYDRTELAKLPARTRKVLGLFASGATFHDQPEEKLRAAGLPHYRPEAPSVAEMTDATLRILGARRQRFLLVVEEEGTDNFGNVNNAAGTFEALRRADHAIGVAQQFVRRHPRTLLLVAADSDASGMQVVAAGVRADQPLPPPRSPAEPPLHGRDGPGSLPFLAAPDVTGKRLPFAVAWIGSHDTYGAVCVRAAGYNAHLVRGSFDNTDIYRLMYRTLFDRTVPSPVRMR
ncbi:MAG: alkaline phosphatase [Verrucomicrobiae bacterium]|nr:alkaline phosphatase [Verrucomicrobiae bacterium]